MKTINFLEKIIPVEEVEELSRTYKGTGKTIILANGVFDLLHSGHLDLLECASKKADFLFVGINSDQSAKSLKGENRPVISQDERAQLIAAFGFVDNVFIFDDTNIAQILRIIKPDFLAKGPDYTLASLLKEEQESLTSLGIQFVICGGKKQTSTSDILKSIQQ